MSEIRDITVTKHIHAQPAAVWAALTDPGRLATWWAAGDVQPVVGHTFRLDMGPFGKQLCEVLAVEPEHLLSYSFGAGMLDTTITWTLEADADGTALTLEHAGFDLASEMGSTAYRGMGGGWPMIVDRLATLLAVGS